MNLRVDDAAVLSALRTAGREAKADARKATRLAVQREVPGIAGSVPHNSGRYAASIRGGATARSAYVIARTPYATVLDKGRSPMTIHAHGGAMSTPYGPRRVVHSPRYPARWTLRKAVFHRADRIAQAVKLGVESALARRL